MINVIEKTKETNNSKQRKDVVSMILQHSEPVSITYPSDISDRTKKIRRILNWDSTTTVAIVTITPEMAKELLEFNTRNRKIIKSAVDKYAQSLVGGDFVMSNDMITFDDDGILSNGQHRLIAIVKTNIPLKTVVMIGVEQSSEMDRGAKRNIVDNLILTGNLDTELNNANIIKTAKALFDHITNRRKYTCAQLEEFMNNNKDAIIDAYENNLLVLQGKQKYVFSVQIASAFLAATIYYKQRYNSDDYNTILSKLVSIRNTLTTGKNANELDSFVFRLRDKIKDGKKDNRKLTSDATFRSVQYVIYHYCKNEPKSVILCSKDYFL